MNDSFLQPAGGKYRCPYCDAINFTQAPPPDTLKCWMCAETFPNDKALPVGPAEDVPVEQNFVFGITSLMLVVTLAAVGFGLFRAMPGLGVLFLVVLTPALVRAQIVTRREQKLNAPLTKQQQFRAFFTSFATTMGVLALIGIGVVVALFGTCILLLTQF